MERIQINTGKTKKLISFPLFDRLLHKNKIVWKRNEWTLKN